MKSLETLPSTRSLSHYGVVWVPGSSHYGVVWVPDTSFLPTDHVSLYPGHKPNFFTSFYSIDTVSLCPGKRPLPTEPSSGRHCSSHSTTMEPCHQGSTKWVPMAPPQHHGEGKNEISLQKSGQQLQIKLLICWPRTIRKRIWDRYRYRLSVVTDTKCMRRTQTACDRLRLSVTDTKYLWQTRTVCDWHKLSVTDTDYLWETQNGCYRRLYVTEIDCMCQTQTFCERHSLSATYKDCMWRIQTVFSPYFLATIFTPHHLSVWDQWHSEQN